MGEVNVGALFQQLKSVPEAPLQKEFLTNIALDLRRKTWLGQSGCMSVLSEVSMAKLWKQAVDIWQYMQQSGIQRNSFAGSCVSEAFLRGHQWANSLELLENMLGDRMSLDPRLLSTAIELNGKRQLWREALAQFFEEGSLRNRCALRTFWALSAAGRLEEIKNLKKMMHGRRSFDTSKAILSGFAACSAWEDAFDHLQELAHFSLSGKPSLLEEVELMAACSAAARWREACLWLAERAEKPLSVKLLSFALGACSRAGRLEEVNYFLNFMQRKGYWPNTETFNRALLGFSRGGHWLMALRLVADMRKAFRDPDIVTYSTCIRTMKEASAWNVAVALLRGLPSAALQVNVITVASTMKTCEKGFEWKLPLQFLSQSHAKSLELNLIACTAALGAFYESMAWKGSFEILESTKQRNYALDIVPYNVAASSLEKVSRWERALSLVVLANSQRLHANQASFGIVLGACAHGGNLELAASELQRMIRAKFRVTPQFYALALDSSREVASNAAAVSLMLSQLSDQLPSWFHRHRKTDMGVVRHASLAEDMLEQHDYLKQKVYKAFIRCMFKPIQLALGDVKERNHFSESLKEIGCLGASFTLRMLEDLDVSTSEQKAWLFRARQSSRKQLLLLITQMSWLRPSAESVIAWSSHKLFRSEARNLPQGPVRTDEHTEHDTERCLRPILFEHERAEHAERQALLRFLEVVLEQKRGTLPAERWPS